MNSAAPYLNLVGRVLLSIMFIQSGVGKIFGYAGAQAMMEQHGVSGALLRHPDRSRRRPTRSARPIHALRGNSPCQVSACSPPRSSTITPATWAR